MAGSAPGAGSQSAIGHHNVQIQNVGSGATISVSVDGQPLRHLPLEPAYLPVSAGIRAPSRLLRARAAVVPWSDRSRILDELAGWLRSDEPYAVKLIGGRGGSGKTRLGVELCRIAEAESWVSGMLRQSSDLEHLEALVGLPSARLIVVDYAEYRSEQLELLLPALQQSAIQAHPVRVLLLVRAAPRDSDDWLSVVNSRGDLLDSALDGTSQLVLQAAPFGLPERVRLFESAVRAMAPRLAPASQPGEAPDLSSADFATPLMVVIAAYLATCDNADVPLTRERLLQELTKHEDHYWEGHPGAPSDAVLRHRVVALASLTGAESEAEAVDLLRLEPDLSDAPAERRGQLARWVHQLYPGPSWWNAVEPDLLGEHLGRVS